MSAIKRSESARLTRKTSSSANSVTNGDSSTKLSDNTTTTTTTTISSASDRTSSLSEIGDQRQQQHQSTSTSSSGGSSKLVFGLNARTNRVKHDEYAEQRLKASSTSTSPAQTSSQSNDTINPNQQQKRLSTDTIKTNKQMNGISNEPNRVASQQSDNKKSGTIRASKYGNFYKPQDLSRAQPMTATKTTTKEPTTITDNANTKTTSRNKPEELNSTISSSPVSVSKNQSQQQQQQVQPKSTVRARSKSPERGAKQMARRKSLEDKSKIIVDHISTKKDPTPLEQNKTKSRSKTTSTSKTTTTTPTITSTKEGNSEPIESCDKQVIIKARTQFNILPPPQLSVATTGRGSVVSYAKSRIYDKPSKQILSNPPLIMSHLNLGAAAAANAGDGGELPSSLVFSTNYEQIPQAILSGRKPPKQVNVSKARKEWEGGEPFAKCRSRKRLAAAQRNKNKLLIHESWSMTSVVATQQLQLQQALAASQATHRSGAQQSDPSVKVLTRGSVLERIQQYERAPGSGSVSRSSSASSFGDDDDFSDELSDLEYPFSDVILDKSATEASLTIRGTSGSQGDPINGRSTGKQAAYRNKVCNIQHQQQQITAGKATSNGKQQLTASNRSITSADSSQGQNARRLSFIRRSSINRLSGSSGGSGSTTNLIPKFYNPKGTKPNTLEIELEKRNIVDCFDKLPERRAQLIGPSSKKHFYSISLACGLSEYYKIPLLLYVKYLLDTKPEMFTEANLIAPNGIGYQSMGRRRSSLVPLNPNNVPMAASALTNGSNPATVKTNNDSTRKVSLARSNSQQIQPTTMTSNKTSSSLLTSTTESKRKNLLQKSASTDNNNNNTNNNNKPTINETDPNKCENRYVSCEQFLACWKQIIDSAYDVAARFTHLLTFGQRDYLLPDDFVPLVQSIIDDHPGLKFLRAAPDFHMRYIQTVIARIYYCVNRSWTGKIKLSELRRSNFLAVLQVLAQENDINQISDYFSYEHFYVIYCKFWTLDQDHDLLISKEDLARHNDASISSRIIDRIFSGIVSRQIAKSGRMSYSDFVWFLISEEDKKHPRSVEYWFRLMDLDGDGYISMYELEYFYYEQMKRLELMNIEALPFLDTACQILDLVNPKDKNKISLADLKRTKMATIFFDTFINLEKYLEHESREFVSTRDVVQDGVVISDWDRYASEEYENMVTEESTV